MLTQSPPALSPLQRLMAATRAIDCTDDAAAACTAAVQSLVAQGVHACAVDLSTQTTWRRIAAAHQNPLAQAQLHDRSWARANSATQATLAGVLGAGRSQKILLAEAGECWPQPAQILGPQATETDAALPAQRLLLVALKVQGVSGLLCCELHPAAVCRSEATGSAQAEDTVLVAQEVARHLALVLANRILGESARLAHQARDEFLRMASHELRTPLTVLTLQLGSLNRLVHNDEGTKAVGERIVQKIAGTTSQTTRLTHVVDSILHAASLRHDNPITLNVAPIHVGALCREVAERWQDAASRAGCTLEVCCGQDVQAHWDSAHMAQVLAHLLGNAFKFGPGAPVTITVQAHADAVVLQVRDHGPGVDAEAATRIFQSFARNVSATEYGGMGLGLFISRKIVEAHGGQLRLAKPGQSGALFELRLPRSAPAAAVSTPSDLQALAGI